MFSGRLFGDKLSLTLHSNIKLSRQRFQNRRGSGLTFKHRERMNMRLTQYSHCRQSQWRKASPSSMPGYQPLSARNVSAFFASRISRSAWFLSSA